MNKQNLLSVFFLIGFFVNTSSATVFGDDRFIFNLGGEVPFYIGMQGQYNFSTKWYSKVSTGFALELFTKPHDQLLQVLHVSEHAQLFTSSLVNSVVLDARIGVAHSIYEGIYLEIGYNTMVYGRGEVTGLDINSFSGTTNFPEEELLYQVGITTHGTSLHIGYRIILADHLTLNIDSNVYKPLFANISLDKNISSKKLKHKIQKNLVQKNWYFSVGVWIGLMF